MSERTASGLVWRVPIAVADVPETGRRAEIVADDSVRAAIAEDAGLAALPRLKAEFDLSRLGTDGLRLAGRVQATVVQNCVVTLEPIENEVDEPIDLVYVPPESLPAHKAGPPDADAEDPPETLHDGTVDLGAVATEFLLLGLDPYPRKPGAVFDAPPAGDPAGHPFAALAALKKAENPNKD